MLFFKNMEEIQKGQLHLLTLLAEESYKVFTDLGFEINMGPEMENEWYNFDALNVPADHPARDMQDTFFIKNKTASQENQNFTALPSLRGLRHGQNSDSLVPPSDSFVLRTHNTNTTARKMAEMAKENINEGAYISIGKVFRNEATDATHEMQFYQIDGFMIAPIKDENTSANLSNMKAILIEFYKKVLGVETEIEFRPSFFPFTEPSVEVHAKFTPSTDSKSSQQASSGQDGRWLEMMGGGMLHPEVLKKAGFDPEKVQGFAFGGGLDRIAMIRWNIPDVRLFYQGDLRLNQF